MRGPRWFEQVVAQSLAATGRSLEYKTIAQGAATTVWAAAVADAGAIGGHYVDNCRVSPVLTPDVAGSSAEGVLAYAVDATRAHALWDLSETLVKEHFHVEGSSTTP